MLKTIGCLVIILGILGAQPLAAQDQEKRDALVAVMLDEFLSEQRVHLTCSALDALNYESIVRLWDLFVKDVLSLMKNGGISLIRQSQFVAAARPEALVLAGATPFSEVRTFCHANPDWARNLAHQRVFPRYSELRKLLERK